MSRDEINTKCQETDRKRNVDTHTQLSRNAKRRNSNEMSRDDTKATCQETKRKRDVKRRY